MDTEASLKEAYPKIADMFSSPRLVAVVTGSIVDIEYRYPDGVAQSVLTVDVTGSLKGSVSGRITVWEDGGYVRATAVAEEIREKFPDLKTTIDESDVVDVQFEGAKHPVVGEQVLLFLAKNPNPGKTKSYRVVSSVYGHLTKTDRGFERLAAPPNSGWERSADLRALRKAARSG